MKLNTKKLVIAAMLAALTCAATMVIVIPNGLGGYVNLGDCIVLVSGLLLGPVYGVLAAGIGSALADIMAAYMIYVPATLVIKALVALVVCVVFRMLSKKLNGLVSKIIAAVIAELVMVIGYFLYEILLYGAVGAAAGIYSNLIQGAAGLVFGVLISEVLTRNSFIKKHFD